MKENVYFTNLPESSFIKKFIQQKLKRSAHLFKNRHKKIQFFLRVENDKQTPGKDEYICEVHLIDGKRPRSVEKRSTNIYKAISQTFLTLKRILREKKHQAGLSRIERRRRLMEKKSPEKRLQRQLLSA